MGRRCRRPKISPRRIRRTTWRGASFESAFRSGLDGYYEAKLEWVPTDLSAQEPAHYAVGPSMDSAVQSQLGLTLEARQGPLDCLVVDSAQKVPTEN